jgi:hypothetical protein
MSREAVGDGYDWAIAEALKLDGDLGRILAIQPPPGRPEPWRQGFYMARADLIGELLPQDANLTEYLAGHTPDAADRVAVELFADSAVPRDLR